MLNDDSKAIARFKEELNVMGEFLAKEGNQQALTFCYTLLMLCDHVLSKQSLSLEVPALYLETINTDPYAAGFMLQICPCCAITCSASSCCA